MRRIVAGLALLVVASAFRCDTRPSFDDPARPVVVRRGGEFEIALESNHSTGYEWVLADSAALGPLRLVSKDYTIPRQNRDRNGAGGTERWIFRTEGPGNGVVALVYKRPWESTPPADSARFRVRVR